MAGITIDRVRSLVNHTVITCKIKGDAGEYDVLGIDWYEHKILVARACGNEWVGLHKIKLVEGRTQI